MTYSFPYQKIMDLQANRTSQAKWMFQSAMGNLRQEQSDLHELYDSRDVIAGKLAELQKTGATVGKLLLANTYLNVVDAVIEQKRLQVAEAEEEVTERQLELSRFQQQEKMWQRLKDRRVRQYFVELNRETQKELDEMGSSRHMRGDGAHDGKR